MHFSTERYRSFVQSSGAPALELGCGDSSPFYDLAAEGMDIEGVDSSPDMVRRGRERLAADGAEAPVRLQRMEELTLERRFASIYLAGPIRRPSRHFMPSTGICCPAAVPWSLSGHRRRLPMRR